MSVYRYSPTPPVLAGDGAETAKHVDAPTNPCGVSRAFNRQAFQGGGGCMNGKALDIVRMLDAIRAGGEPILSKETTQQMMSNQIGADAFLEKPVEPSDLVRVLSEL